MIRNIIEDLIRNVSGSLGNFLRRLYYKKMLRKCGKGLVIGEGVFIENPMNIEFGNNVWVDRGCILMSGKLHRTNVRVLKSPTFEGKIIIGDNSHLGIRTIIQAHGGVSIGHSFTSGSDAKIYTLSNDVRRTTSGTNNSDKDANFYNLHPVRIGTNVWLGMQSMILGGTIGNDVFINANTVSTQDIISNTIIKADGSTEIRLK